MTKKPLGRGLSALLSVNSPPADNEEIRDVEIDLIRPNQQQPRTSFQEEKLQDLAQSIRTSGIIQPVLVRRSGGLFELIAGERRWRAAQIAGLSRIPAIIRDVHTSEAHTSEWQSRGHLVCHLLLEKKKKNI